MTFDSKREAERYLELKAMEHDGKITGLHCQVPFELVPTQTVDGETLRSASYIADFTYWDKDGKFVVEDAKGLKTDLYILKKKMVLYRYGILIKEV